jgi:hypothetical protein
MAEKRDEAPKPHKSGKKQHYKTYKVSPAQFIEAWMTSTYLDEVADKLGMPKDIVAARASNYRGMGLPLKKLKRRSTKGLDIKALTELIRKYETEGAPPAPKSPPPRLSEEEVDGLKDHMRKHK